MRLIVIIMYAQNVYTRMHLIVQLQDIKLGHKFESETYVRVLAISNIVEYFEEVKRVYGDDIRKNVERSRIYLNAGEMYERLMCDLRFKNFKSHGKLESVCDSKTMHGTKFSGCSGLMRFNKMNEISIDWLNGELIPFITCKLDSYVDDMDDMADFDLPMICNMNVYIENTSKKSKQMFVNLNKHVKIDMGCDGVLFTLLDCYEYNESYIPSHDQIHALFIQYVKTCRNKTKQKVYQLKGDEFDDLSKTRMEYMCLMKADILENMCWMKADILEMNVDVPERRDSVKMTIEDNGRVIKLTTNILNTKDVENLIASLGVESYLESISIELLKNVINKDTNEPNDIYFPIEGEYQLIDVFKSEPYPVELEYGEIEIQVLSNGSKTVRMFDEIEIQGLSNESIKKTFMMNDGVTVLHDQFNCLRCMVNETIKVAHPLINNELGSGGNMCYFYKNMITNRFLCFNSDIEYLPEFKKVSEVPFEKECELMLIIEKMSLNGGIMVTTQTVSNMRKLVDVFETMVCNVGIESPLIMPSATFGCKVAALKASTVVHKSANNTNIDKGITRFDILDDLSACITQLSETKKYVEMYKNDVIETLASLVIDNIYSYLSKSGTLKHINRNRISQDLVTLGVRKTRKAKGYVYGICA